MESTNYELVINEKQVNWFALLSIIGVFVLLYIPFALYWGFDYTYSGFKYMIKVLVFWLVPIIIVHEGLHGLFWALALKGNFRKISLMKKILRQAIPTINCCYVISFKRSFYSRNYSYYL